MSEREILATYKGKPKTQWKFETDEGGHPIASKALGPTLGDLAVGTRVWIELGDDGRVVSCRPYEGTASEPMRRGRSAPAPRPPGQQARTSGAVRVGTVNPYNFAPLTEATPRSTPPGHAAYVHHTGSVRLTLEARSPVFTRGQEGSIDRTDAPSELRPVMLDGRYVIPATSVKGVVRSLAEALSGSCLRVVDLDRRFSRRERPGNDNPALNVPFVVVGTPDDRSTWKLRPGRAYRLPIRRVDGGRFVVTGNDLTGCCDGDEVDFVVLSEPTGDLPGLAQLPTAESGSSSRRGVLKLSDVQPNDPREPKQARKAQYVVVETTDPLIELTHRVIVEYDAAIQASITEDDRDRDRGLLGADGRFDCARHRQEAPALRGRWGQRHPRHPLRVGDVVWGDSVRPSIIGAAQVARHAEPLGMQDVIPGSVRPCDDPGQLCPACQIFGMVAPEGRGREVAGYAGHTQIGWAIGPTAADVTLEALPLPVLSTPKPSFGSFYLRTDDGTGVVWSDEKREPAPEVRGRKFYWHQPDVRHRDASEEARLASDVEALPAGTVFHLEVRFDNLGAELLGLLLAALHPGLLGEEFASAAHKVGMGKAAGLGSIAVRDCELLLDDRGARYASTTSATTQEHDPGEFVNAFRNGLGDDRHLVDLAQLLDLDAVEGRVVGYPGVPGEGFRWFGHHPRQPLPTPSETVGGWGLPG